jgi:hypothetical protein
MTSFFPLTSGDSVKITDGTNTLSVDANGNLSSSKTLSNILAAQLPTMVRATALGIAGIVPANKKWIIVAIGLSGGGEITIRAAGGAADLACLATTAAGVQNTMQTFAIAAAGEEIYVKTADSWFVYYQIDA